jgi:hypothetical protein
MEILCQNASDVKFFAILEKNSMLSGGSQLWFKNASAGNRQNFVHSGEKISCILGCKIDNKQK